jgi:hypothetical protein
MSLFLARNTGTNDRFAQSQADIISISVMDTGIGFDENNPTTISGITCIEVTYSRTKTGPTAIRLDELVHDTGFITPQQIIAMAVPSGTVVAGGIPIQNAAGIAFPIGDTNSPFPSNICTVYDADECFGAGYWVDAAGGGTTSDPRDVILYHELAHCFHWATGVTTTEPLAEADENDMRDVRGLPHRDTNSHNGGCGGGPTNCCIVASLATNSPYSDEIRHFRRFRDQVLRHSMVGDDFFNEFYFRYYSFSPEVTRLMGHNPNLGPIIKEWFVIPLLASLEMLEYYAENQGRRLTSFLREQSKREQKSVVYQKQFLEDLSGYLRIARSYDVQTISINLAGKGREYSGFKKLLKYVNRGTLKDEYIDWALISLVELWVESALMLYSGKSDTEIDDIVYKKIVVWVGLLPVSELWEGFSKLETESELGNLEKFIFDSRSKETFSRRLIEKYGRNRPVIVRWAKGEERYA